MASAAEILRGAAHEIMVSGWTQGGSGGDISPATGTKPGPCCAAIAIQRVAAYLGEDPGKRDGVVDAAFNCLRSALPRKDRENERADVVDWNDDPKRTVADVVSALEEAAKIAEQRS